jgi:hypothetical protein
MVINSVKRSSSITTAASTALTTAAGACYSPFYGVLQIRPLDLLRSHIALSYYACIAAVVLRGQLHLLLLLLLLQQALLLH